MPRREDEISPREAARRCDVVRETVYRWVEMAEGEKRGPLVGGVRRDATRHLWIRVSVLRAGPDYF